MPQPQYLPDPSASATTTPPPQLQFCTPISLTSILLDFSSALVFSSVPLVSDSVPRELGSTSPCPLVVFVNLLPYSVKSATHLSVKNVLTGRIGEADRVSEELDDENMGTCIPQGGRVTRCQSLEGMKSKLEGMSRHLEVTIG